MTDVEDADTGIKAETALTITELTQRYDGVLKRFLMRHLKSREDVEDFAQEVYLRLVKHGKPEELRNPQAFILHTASNLLKDWGRRQRVRLRDQHVSISELDVASPAASPEQILLSKEGLEIIADVLNKVKPKCRKAFVLHRFKWLNYNEIALEMGISSSMVKHHICHVLVQCRERMRDVPER